MTTNTPLSADVFQLIVESLPAPVVLIDPEHRVAHANPAFLRLIGLNADAIFGHSLWDYWPEDEFSFLKEAYEKVLDTHESVFAEFESLDDGSFSEISLSWRDGYVVGMISEVTAHRRLEQDMEFQLTVVEKLIEEFSRLNHAALDDVATDPLTGLANRRRVEEIGEVLLNAAREHALEVAFLVVDIDHFKRFNDVYGHLQGDVVLRQLGAFMSGFAAESETPARIGGEEFLFLCPGIDLPAAQQRAEELLAGIREIDGIPHKVTASIGVAGFRAGDTLWTHIMARADRALYAAKAQGRNQVVRWSPSLPPKPGILKVA